MNENDKLKKVTIQVPDSWYGKIWEMDVTKKELEFLKRLNKASNGYVIIFEDEDEYKKHNFLSQLAIILTIMEELEKLEKEMDIRIIFASESGARSWGLDSPISDYDVRFIYHRPVREYLKIHRPKDVINGKNGNIDFEGYDVYKYLELVAKSNVNMLEMLNSDIVYYDNASSLMDAIREFANSSFSPITAFYHYHALGMNNFSKYVLHSSEKDKNLAKCYVYALRGLLGAIYVYDNWELLPKDFEEVVKTSEILPEEVRSMYLEKFIPMKRGLLVEAPQRSKIVDEFLAAEFAARKELLMNAKKRRIKGKEISEDISDILVDTLLAGL